jgi:hypothetical protein
MKEFGQAFVVGLIFWSAMTPLIIHAINISPLFK